MSNWAESEHPDSSPVVAGFLNLPYALTRKVPEPGVLLPYARSLGLCRGGEKNMAWVSR